ncbi:MAG: hypothetical protein IKH45_05265, partial [Neisseriaceae bacterium]|nr:hypothetical protein [Neisseriaceae bacterium]
RKSNFSLKFKLGTAIFCGLFLTACADMDLANLANLGQSEANKTTPIKLSPEQQVLKQTQLEPIVPELLAMEQKNPKRYTTLQNDITRCLNPEFPMDYEQRCVQVKNATINVLYDQHKNKMPIDKKTQELIQMWEENKNYFMQTDMKLSAILKHRMDLYEKYIDPWDTYALSIHLENNPNLDYIFRNFRIHLGLMYANKSNNRKEVVFSHLQEGCNIYTQFKLGKPLSHFDFPAESDCIVLGRDKTFGKETTQAYTKLKSMTESERRQLVKQENQKELTKECLALPVDANKQFTLNGVTRTIHSYSVSGIKNLCQSECNNKNGKACFHIGTVYTNEKDLVQAEKYFKQACNYGFTNACHSIGAVASSPNDATYYGKNGKQTATPELCTSLSYKDLALSLSSQETREAGTAVSAMFGLFFNDKKIKEDLTQMNQQLSTQMNQQMASWTGANPDAVNHTPDSIFKSCQPACSQKNGKACTFMGIILNKKKQFAQAEPYLKQGCNNGYGRGCIELERFHYHENKRAVATPDDTETCQYIDGIKTDCYTHKGGIFTPDYTIQRTGEISTVIKGRKPNKATALQYRQKGLALFKKACQQGDSEACSNYKYYSDIDRAILGGDYVGWEQ